jgi:hypothetical protein
VNAPGRRELAVGDLNHEINLGPGYFAVGLSHERSEVARLTRVR